MRQVLNNELKRAFCSYKMLFVIAVELIIVILYTVQEVFPICFEQNPFLYSIVDTGKVDGIRGVYYAWIGFNHSQHRTMLFTALPLFAAIPYGSSLYTDEKSRYVENVLLRCRRSEYYTSKLIVMFLSGGAVAVFPFILSMLINMALLPFERVFTSSFWFTINDRIAAGELFFKAPFLYCLLYLLVLFIGFGMLNCLCFTASYIFANRFVVMSFPFVIYYVSFVVCSVLKVYRASPWSYMRFNEMDRDYLGAVIINTIIVAAAVLSCLWLRGRRKSNII